MINKTFLQDLNKLLTPNEFKVFMPIYLYYDTFKKPYFIKNDEISKNTNMSMDIINEALDSLVKKEYLYYYTSRFNENIHGYSVNCSLLYKIIKS